MSLIHMALAFVIRHPAVTAAIIGPRTMEQLESQLGAADVELDDALLDRIDEIVAPGHDDQPDRRRAGRTRRSRRRRGAADGGPLAPRRAARRRTAGRRGSPGRSRRRAARSIVDGVVVADELGDRLLAQARAPSPTIASMTSSSVRAARAGDEVAVDLQVVGRQVLEVVEGAEAGAEVVDREAAAERGERLGEAARVVHVARSSRSR